MELAWEKMFGEKFISPGEAAKKGPKKLRRILKGGLFKKVWRTEEEVLKILSDSGITENPAGLMDSMLNGGKIYFGKGMLKDGASGYFSLEKTTNSKGEERYRTVDAYVKVDDDY